MKILDLSAGNRSVWFNRLHPDTLFIDIRPEMHPTVIADTRCLPLPSGMFDLIVFDPPHMTHGAGSDMAKAYSSMLADDIKDLIRRTSDEAFRCSTPHALMAFKWNNHDVRTDHILPLMEGWAPLFGHRVAHRSIRGSSTYWMLLEKRESLFEDQGKMVAVLGMDHDE